MPCLLFYFALKNTNEWSHQKHNNYDTTTTNYFINRVINYKGLWQILQTDNKGKNNSGELIPFFFVLIKFYCFD